MLKFKKGRLLSEKQMNEKYKKKKKKKKKKKPVSFGTMKMSAVNHHQFSQKFQESNHTGNTRY